MGNIICHSWTFSRFQTISCSAQGKLYNILSSLRLVSILGNDALCTGFFLVWFSCRLTYSEITITTMQQFNNRNHCLRAIRNLVLKWHFKCPEVCFCLMLWYYIFAFTLSASTWRTNIICLYDIKMGFGRENNNFMAVAESWGKEWPKWKKQCLRRAKFL